MSDAARAFFNGMLIENPVFMTYLGAIAIAVLPKRAHGSSTTAIRLGIAFFLSALVGVALATALPPIVAPLAFLFAGLGAVGALLHFGELSGTWYGLPRGLIVVPLMIGAPVLAMQQADITMAVARAGGGALGFVGAFLLFGAIRETVIIAESRKEFKTTPVILFSMALFSLALSGFLFW